MTRPIEFRGWDIIRKVMIKITQFYWPHWVKGYIPDAKHHDFYEEGEGEYYLRHQFEVMQFTGLLDRNGKKIFEGDIMALGEKNNYFVEYKTDRFWLSQTCVEKSSHPGWSDGYYRICLPAYCNRYEIIGNIHQHPELLK